MTCHTFVMTSLWLEVLKDIAYINVDKMPGYRTTSDKELAHGYEQWKDIIEEANTFVRPTSNLFCQYDVAFQEELGNRRAYRT